jgi:hypothetical protein
MRIERFITKIAGKKIFEFNENEINKPTSNKFNKFETSGEQKNKDNTSR